jgi:hypothetical protein
MSGERRPLRIRTLMLVILVVGFDASVVARIRGDEDAGLLGVLNVLGSAWPRSSSCSPSFRVEA